MFFISETFPCRRPWRLPGAAAVLSLACAALGLHAEPPAIGAGASESAAPEAAAEHPTARPRLDAVIEAARREVDALQTRSFEGRVRISIAVSDSLAADYIGELSAAAGRIGARLVVRGVDAGDEGRRLAKVAAVAPGRLPQASDHSAGQARPMPAGTADFADVPYFALSEAAQAAYRRAIRTGLVAMAQKSAAAGFEIDPLFFRRYDIRAVPVVVAEVAPGQSAEKDEAGTARVYVVRGAVSLDWALRHAASRAEEQGNAGDAEALARLSRRAAAEAGDLLMERMSVAEPESSESTATKEPR